jgi:hypothetical protein
MKEAKPQLGTPPTNDNRAAPAQRLAKRARRRVTLAR